MKGECFWSDWERCRKHLLTGKAHEREVFPNRRAKTETG